MTCNVMEDVCRRFMRYNCPFDPVRVRLPPPTTLQQNVHIHYALCIVNSIQKEF